VSTRPTLVRVGTPIRTAILVGVERVLISVWGLAEIQRWVGSALACFFGYAHGALHWRLTLLDALMNLTDDVAQ
jgi:hypothetical protein